jgi:uncharacterized membrane protein YgcG
MDDEMQARDAGTIELGRRLEAFARARLTPDPQATARTRARVMREARLSFEAARIAVHVAPALATSGRAKRRGMIVAIVAAALWLGIAVGSIAAAHAGGPLYPTRMWIETSLLPAGAEARTAADLNRLDARIAEALAGAAAGDRGAVVASLEAYFTIAEDAIAQSQSDAVLEARVAAALDHHQVVLTAIAARLGHPGKLTATDAIEWNIERAIEHNAAVIRAIGSHPKPQGGASGGSSGGTSGGSAGGSGPAAGGATGVGASRTPAVADPVRPSDRPAPAVEKPTKTPPARNPGHQRQGQGN